MELGFVFERVGLAAGLGLLVGLQRERADSKLAGIRTFPLISLAGALGALLGETYGALPLAAGFLAVSAMLVIGNVAKLRSGDNDPGLTTEMAALLMFGVGAYCVLGYASMAVAVGGGVVVLLHLRESLHGFARRIGEDDLRAIMQFVLIAMVILPVLPDRTYGPFSVFNPREVWMMVVLIVGIGLLGYVAYKFFGARAGALLGGVLGGLISSTATSVSYARRSRESGATAALASVVVMVASTVAFARVIVEVAAVAPAHLGRIAPPLAAMFVFMIVISLVVWLKDRKVAAELPPQSNPAQLKSALIFGALYAVVIFLIAAAKQYFGDRGLYVVAVISGMTDMDAITLSTSQLAKDGRVGPTLAWRVILIASMSNLVFKGVTVAALGSRPLAVRIVVLFGVALAGGALILWLWPEAWTFESIRIPGMHRDAATQPSTAPG